MPYLFTGNLTFTVSRLPSRVVGDTVLSRPSNQRKARRSVVALFVYIIVSRKLSGTGTSVSVGQWSRVFRQQAGFDSFSKCPAGSGPSTLKCISSSPKLSACPSPRRFYPPSIFPFHSGKYRKGFAAWMATRVSLPVEKASRRYEKKRTVSVATGERHRADESVYDSAQFRVEPSPESVSRLPRP